MDTFLSGITGTVALADPADACTPLGPEVSGNIALIGVLTGQGPPEASLFPLVTRNVDVNGIYVGSRAMFERMNQFLTEQNLHPIIDREFDFDDALKAYDFLESGGHFGKVVIKV